MLSFGVKTEKFTEVARLLAHMPGAAEKATARAINRAVDKARTEVIARVAERYNISSAEIQKTTKIVGARPNRLAAVIYYTSRRGLAITKVKTKPKMPPTQKAVEVRMRRRVSSEIIAGQKKEWPHAFIAQMKSGHVGLFSREKDSKKRLPIHERVTVNVPGMAGHYSIINSVLELAQAKLDEELDRQMQLFLQGKVN